jgi:hypothetical protein
LWKNGIFITDIDLIRCKISENQIQRSGFPKELNVREGFNKKKCMEFSKKELRIY